MGQFEKGPVDICNQPGGKNNIGTKRVFYIPIPKEPSRDKLGVRADRRERPNVPESKLSLALVSRGLTCSCPLIYITAQAMSGYF
jgi:hypothetical protein